MTPLYSHPIAQEMTSGIPASPKRGGHRALRVARRKAYYAAVPARTAANKKRTLARQLRRFPEDLQASAVYESRYGKGALISPLTVPHARAVARVIRTAKAKRAKVEKVNA